MLEDAIMELMKYQNNILLYLNRVLSHSLKGRKF